MNHRFGDYEVQTSRSFSIFATERWSALVYHKGNYVAGSTSFGSEASALDWAASAIRVHRNSLNKVREAAS